VPQIRRQLEEISLREQLETAVKSAPVATPDKLHDYYAAHPDKFTEPERLRASIILLGVDPSSTRETWQMAQQRGTELHAELLAGADFAALARRHSTDPTAENGGDMGYLHQGMLAENVHAALQSLAPGGLTPPLRVLEGVAVLRLDERHPARHLPYPEVQARVAALWADDAGLQARQALLERLRGAAEIVIDEAAMASLREELIALLN
jgi:parvulin-like peptidyl-prolyl isomerase